jgi:hypothetical protein
MEATVGRRKQVEVSGNMWMSVLESTGQSSFKN